MVIRTTRNVQHYSTPSSVLCCPLASSLPPAFILKSFSRRIPSASLSLACASCILHTWDPSLQSPAEDFKAGRLHTSPPILAQNNRGTWGGGGCHTENNCFPGAARSRAHTLHEPSCQQLVSLMDAWGSRRISHFACSCRGSGPCGDPFPPNKASAPFLHPQVANAILHSCPSPLPLLC